MSLVSVRGPLVRPAVAKPSPRRAAGAHGGVPAVRAGDEPRAEQAPVRRPPQDPVAALFEAELAALVHARVAESGPALRPAAAPRGLRRRLPTTRPV